MRRAAPAQTAAPRSDREALEAAHEFLPVASRSASHEEEAPAPALTGSDAARARAAAGDAAHAARLAAAYDARLFREFALVDLSRRVPADAPGAAGAAGAAATFRGPLGLRWRTQAEVLSGKGQFVCAAVAPAPACDATGLLTFEAPFAYAERGERKAALVKLRLCARCAQRAFAAPAALEEEPTAAEAVAEAEAAAEEPAAPTAPPAGSKRSRSGGAAPSASAAAEGGLGKGGGGEPRR